jgi:hypothetical protein
MIPEARAKSPVFFSVQRGFAASKRQAPQIAPHSWQHIAISASSLLLCAPREGTRNGNSGAIIALCPSNNEVNVGNE